MDINKYCNRAVVLADNANYEDGSTGIRLLEESIFYLEWAIKDLRTEIKGLYESLNDNLARDANFRE